MAWSLPLSAGCCYSTQQLETSVPCDARTERIMSVVSFWAGVISAAEKIRGRVGKTWASTRCGKALGRMKVCGSASESWRPMHEGTSCWSGLPSDQLATGWTKRATATVLLIMFKEIWFGWMILVLISDEQWLQVYIYMAEETAHRFGRDRPLPNGRLTYGRTPVIRNR